MPRRSTIMKKILIILALITLPSTAGAQVKIDNFNVIQRNVISTGSDVDFRLTISQSDNSLDCSSLPLTNGSLQWIVWYTTPGDYVRVVRQQSVGLPLNPNPLSLDFTEKNFQPSSRAINSGSMNFYAAIGCLTYTTQTNLSRNLAVSSFIPVTIDGKPLNPNVPNGGGGSGTGGGGGGGSAQPGQGISLGTWKVPNPWAGVNSVFDLVDKLTTVLLNIAIPIAVIMIIYAGFMFLTSAGNSSRITKAKNILWYTILGFAVLLIGKGFFLLIESILNLGA